MSAAEKSALPPLDDEDFSAPHVAMRHERTRQSSLGILLEGPKPPARQTPASALQAWRAGR
jgi:hypothetical protein